MVDAEKKPKPKRERPIGRRRAVETGVKRSAVRAVCFNCVTGADYDAIASGVVALWNSSHEAACRKCGSRTTNRIGTRAREDA